MPTSYGCRHAGRVEVTRTTLELLDLLDGDLLLRMHVARRDWTHKFVRIRRRRRSSCSTSVRGNWWRGTISASALDITTEAGVRWRRASPRQASGVLCRGNGVLYAFPRCNRRARNRDAEGPLARQRHPLARPRITCRRTPTHSTSYRSPPCPSSTASVCTSCSPRSRSQHEARLADVSGDERHGRRQRAADPLVVR